MFKLNNTRKKLCLRRNKCFIGIIIKALYMLSIEAKTKNKKCLTNLIIVSKTILLTK